MRNKRSEENMRHFLYAMRRNQPAPVGDGDIVSWFTYYKLAAGEEVFIPMPPALETLKAGDSLWFSADDAVLAQVKVLRVEPDHINGRMEIWFDARELNCTTHFCQAREETGPLAEETARGWIPLLERH